MAKIDHGSAFCADGFRDSPALKACPFCGGKLGARNWKTSVMRAARASHA